MENSAVLLLDDQSSSRMKERATRTRWVSQDGSHKREMVEYDMVMRNQAQQADTTSVADQWRRWRSIGEIAK